MSDQVALPGGGVETAGDVVRRWTGKNRADRDTAATAGPRPSGGPHPAQPAATSFGQPPTTGGQPAPIGPPPKLRRRPALIAAAIALIAIGGLAASWLATNIGSTHPVIVMRADVPRGATISASDITVAMVPNDPTLNTIPGDRRSQVIGLYAAADLTAGSTLTPASVTDTKVPPAGQSLVGVSLSPAQLPARPLRPGDQVRIVSTPRPQDDPPTADPASVRATVVDIRTQPDGARTIVDVTIATSDAANLAARAATGRVALILDPRTG